LVSGTIRVLDAHFAMKNIKQSFVKPMLIGSFGSFSGGDTDLFVHWR
jgi:hypothetical protein